MLARCCLVFLAFTICVVFVGIFSHVPREQSVRVSQYTWVDEESIQPLFLGISEGVF